MDAEELTEHFLGRAECKLKAAQNIEVIEIVCAIMVAGMRATLATIAQSIFAILIVYATLFLC